MSQPQPRRFRYVGQHAVTLVGHGALEPRDVVTAADEREAQAIGRRSDFEELEKPLKPAPKAKE